MTSVSIPQISSWRSDRIKDLSEVSLGGLLEAQIPAVKVSGFCTPAELTSLKLGLFDLSVYSQSVPQVLRIGISQYEEGIRNAKSHYFAEAAKLRPKMEQLFRESFDPVARLCQVLKEHKFNAAILEEPDYGQYHAGVGKRREGVSPIHVDFAPQDSPGWKVGESKAQLAWNLYLSNPEGGQLLLWDKLWQPEHDVHKVADNYYYGESVVAGSTQMKVDVFETDLIIINSRKYHAVSKASNRLTFGSFISYFNDDSLGLWS